MKPLVVIALLAMTAQIAAADSGGHVAGAIGVGSAHPYRPGERGAASTVDLTARWRTWQVRLSTRNEGNRALQGEGTALIASLGVGWHPSLSRDDRYLRVELYSFFVLDLQPAVGLGVDGSFGYRSERISTGFYVDWHTDWYQSWGDHAPALAGLTTGAEVTARRGPGFARLRAGVVALRAFDASASVGVSWDWD